MDKDRYLRTQRKLLELAREVHELDLDAFVDAINTAEAVAPLLDPTAFKHGGKMLGIVKRLAESARLFRDAFPDPEAALEGALDAASYTPLSPSRGGGFIQQFARSRPAVDEHGEPTFDDVTGPATPRHGATAYPPERRP